MSATTCKGCGEQIVWFITDAGKKMPVDASSVEVGDVQYDRGRHVSHFSTCPKSNEFRRKPVSKNNFKNAPPTGAPAGAQKGASKDQPVEAPAYKVGEMIRCLQTSAFGVIVNVHETLVVKWSNGDTSHTYADAVVPTAPTVFYQAIREFTEQTFGITAAELQEILDGIAGDRDQMSFEVLSQLEQEFLSRSTVESDEDYEGVWGSIEETAAEGLNTEGMDLAGAYLMPANLGQEVEEEVDIFKEFEDAEEATEETPDPKPENQDATTTAPATNADASAANTTDAAPAGDASASQSATSSEAKARVWGVDFGLQKLENGDWIDLATGEILGRDWRLKNLGWSEWPECPKLPANATKEQKDGFKLQLEDYAAKCDEILELILERGDKMKRWLNAHNDRCKPLVAEIEMWQEVLTPMSKELGKAGLKGKAQTYKLPSGQISFTKSGGWGFADYDLAKKEVAKRVEEQRAQALRDMATAWGIHKDQVEQFVSDAMAALNAVPEQFKGITELSVSVDYPKFTALVKKGALEEFPGTKKSPEDRFAKVAFKPPKDTGSASEGESEDG